MTCDWCGRPEDGHTSPCPEGVVEAIRPRWAQQVVRALLDRHQEARSHENGVSHTATPTPTMVVLALFPELSGDVEADDGEMLSAARDLVAEIRNGMEVLRAVEAVLIHPGMDARAQADINPEAFQHPFVVAVRDLQAAAPGRGMNEARVLRVALHDVIDDDEIAPPAVEAPKPGLEVEGPASDRPATHLVECPLCAGAKVVAGFTCWACEGWGQVEIEGLGVSVEVPL